MKVCRSDGLSVSSRRRCARWALRSNEAMSLRPAGVIWIDFLRRSSLLVFLLQQAAPRQPVDNIGDIRSVEPKLVGDLDMAYARCRGHNGEDAPLNRRHLLGCAFL